MRDVTLGDLLLHLHQLHTCGILRFYARRSSLALAPVARMRDFTLGDLLLHLHHLHTCGPDENRLLHWKLRRAFSSGRSVVGWWLYGVIPIGNTLFLYIYICTYRIIIQYGLTLLRLASTFCRLTPSPHWQYARHWSSESLPDKELLSDSLAASETHRNPTSWNTERSENIWGSLNINVYSNMVFQHIPTTVVTAPSTPFSSLNHFRKIWDDVFCWILFFPCQPHPRSSKRQDLARGIRTSSFESYKTPASLWGSMQRTWGMSGATWWSKQTPASREILWGPMK